MNPKTSMQVAVVTTFLRHFTNNTQQCLQEAVNRRSALSPMQLEHQVTIAGVTFFAHANIVRRPKDTDDVAPSNSDCVRITCSTLGQINPSADAMRQLAAVYATTVEHGRDDKLSFTFTTDILSTLVTNYGQMLDGITPALAVGTSPDTTVIPAPPVDIVPSDVSPAGQFPRPDAPANRPTGVIPPTRPDVPSERELADV